MKGTSIKRKLHKTRTVVTDLTAAGGICVGGKAKGGGFTAFLSPAGYGAVLPAEVKRVWHPGPRAEFLVLGKNNKLYFFGEKCKDSFCSLYSPQPYVSDEWRDGVLIRYCIGTGGGMKYHATAAGVIAYTRIDTVGGIAKNGRIFAVDAANGYRIVWTSENGADDIINNENIGWVLLNTEQGKVIKLMHCGDKILAVRERGFSFITAYGTEENFKTENCRATCPEVNADSVAVICGDVYFFSEGKIYRFVNGKVETVGCPFAETVTEVTCAAELGGTYFIGGKSAELNRRVILAYEPSDGNSYVIDCAADALCVHDGLYAFCGNKAYRLIKSEEFTFTGGNVDFGTRNIKCLTRIETESGAPVTVTVETESGTRTYVCDGVVYPALSGKNFKISFTADSDIQSFRLFAEVPA